MQLRLIALVLLLSSTTWGRGTVDYSIHQQFQSPRAIGMGNTFSGINDYNAVFYNPAALAVIEEGEINIGLQAGLTPDIIDFQKEVEDAAGEGSEIEKIDAAGDVLEDHFGDSYHIRGPTLNFIWARPGWAIALVPVDLSVNVGIHQAAAPAAGVKAISDTTIAFGYGMSLNKQKTFNVGATLKAIYRGSVDQSYTALDLADDSNLFREEDINEGLILDFDYAVSWTPEIHKTGFFSFLQYAKPTFVVVGRNALGELGHLGNMHLFSSDSDEDETPEALQSRWDVGSRWELPDIWLFQSQMMFDVRDIGHRYWSPLKGLHTGIEFNWEVTSWLNGGWRAGISQGYFTGGFTGEFAWFHLDLVTYGEEIGTTDARKENRIYMAKLALDF